MVADAYGMSIAEREQFLAMVEVGIERGGQFLLRQVQRGDPHFRELWESMGRMTRFDKRRTWFATRLADFREGLGLAPGAHPNL